MYEIRKRIKFEAAHVLDSAYSEDCKQLHGHSYIVDLFFESEKLNDDGMVVDFGYVKYILRDLLNEWDHAVILSEMSKDFMKYDNIVVMHCNPTAENMARIFYQEVKGSFKELHKVRVHETDTGYAEYWE